MAITNNALDLNLEKTYNVRTIGISDVSIYIPNLIVTGPTIEITPPGFPKISLIFAPKSVNIFNSNSLNITCVTDSSDLSPLPDGIWKLKYSIAPALDNFVEKSFMRVEHIMCIYSKVFLGIDMSDCQGCNSDEIRKRKAQLQEVRLLIDGAVASANDCDEEGAMNKYRKAMEKLKRIKQCECK